MGIGMGEGPDAASKAMREALDYKLLEEDSITGAKAALINVTGGSNMPLAQIEDAIGMIEAESDDNADIIWGNVIRDDFGDRIMVTVIATGFDTHAQMMRPQPRALEVQAAANGPSQPTFAPGPPAAEKEDLNVPTFIRRQAD
jgi:cell division protein FtsZ